jgi:hypothetical protein
VVAWGNNYCGQARVPADLGSVTSVKAGGNCSLALRSDGTVVAWGAFDVRCVYPATVSAGLSNVVAISAGSGHCLALRADGTVAAWGGENYYGQTNVPPGLSGVTQVAAGGAFSIALRDDGTLVMWSGREIAYFLKVPAALGHVVEVAAGGRHSLALVDVEYYPQLTIRRQGPNAGVSWTGGRGPFQLVQSADLRLPGAWENVGEPVTSNGVVLPLGPDNRFLRVLDLTASVKARGSGIRPASSPNPRPP